MQDKMRVKPIIMHVVVKCLLCGYVNLRPVEKELYKFTMSRLTYKSDTLRPSDVRPYIIWDVPIWLDRDAEIRKAGFNPETDTAGVLQNSGWRDYPQYALVVTHDSNLAREDIAVSEQSVYSVDKN